MNKRPVVIAGPTASGKSALALAVALRDDGVVINADALQVYSCWRVLTARPTPEDEAHAPHALYGHVPCDEPYSVGEWLRALQPALAAAEAARRRPVIVGGTGLYLTAATAGLAEIPPIPAQVRAEAEDRLSAGGPEALAHALSAADPETFVRLDARNPVRLRRAWEVLRATGHGLAHWQRTRTRPFVAEAVRLVLDVPVERLDRRIADRFTAMLAAGALEEVRAAIAADRDLRRPSSRALGAAELAAHLRHEIDLGEAERRAILATRRYAKRQRTWFRGRMRDWTWLETDAVRLEMLLEAVPRR